MTIYRIHVSLLDINPPIWRRVEVSSQTTLKQFHRILQIVTGWENCHLHEYLVGGKRYGIQDQDFDEPDGVIVETKVQLSEVLPCIRSWRTHSQVFRLTSKALVSQHLSPIQLRPFIVIGSRLSSF
jgi:hypothetical protein